MKNARRQHRVRAAELHAVGQMIQGANAARGDHRHANRVAHGAGQRQIKTGFGAVAVHAGQQDFTGAAPRHFRGPSDGIQAGVFAPTVAVNVPAGAA